MQPSISGAPFGPWAERGWHIIPPISVAQPSQPQMSTGSQASAASPVADRDYMHGDGGIQGTVALLVDDLFFSLEDAEVPRIFDAASRAALLAAIRQLQACVPPSMLLRALEAKVSGRRPQAITPAHVEPHQCSIARAVSRKRQAINPGSAEPHEPSIPRALSRKRQLGASCKISPLSEVATARQPMQPGQQAWTRAVPHGIGQQQSDSLAVLPLHAIAGRAQEGTVHSRPDERPEMALVPWHSGVPPDTH